ncbi:MAG TPA: pyridoxamine 5'-phosphate oxidase family protein [Anaerolineae bacterium]|nr:pyridoxamine 5'-phosphate oxidase family protein [Anaerolineae bacterium]
MITTPLDPKVKHRLTTETNLWLATVRADNTPHLVPIWFVWVEGRAYVCTSADSVKARNMLDNSSVAFALENGNAPVVLEGCAKPIESAPPAVIDAFQRKYDWNILTDSTYNQLIEIEPMKIRS